MKFIKVEDVTGICFYINPKNIIWIIDQGEYSMITFSGGEQVKVRGSAAEIAKGVDIHE